jgi:hypothetical protein
MKNTTLAVSIVATLAGLGMASLASGAVVVINSRATFDVYVAFQGATVATEDFESFLVNAAPPSASRTVGGTTWTASAAGGLFFGNVDVPPVHRVISTNVSNATLNFTFAPGVQGIGGEMFATTGDFGVVLARITVMLADGTSYVNDQTSASDFVGFYSNGAAIASLSVSTSTPGTYATVDNLYFATVPAPGALALISLAGVVGGRSRRRATSAAV